MFAFYVTPSAVWHLCESLAFSISFFTDSVPSLPFYTLTLATHSLRLLPLMVAARVSSHHRHASPSRRRLTSPFPSLLAFPPCSPVVAAAELVRDCSTELFILLSFGSNYGRGCHCFGECSMCDPVLNLWRNDDLSFYFWFNDPLQKSEILKFLVNGYLYFSHSSVKWGVWIISFVGVFFLINLEYFLTQIWFSWSIFSHCSFFLHILRYVIA